MKSSIRILTFFTLLVAFNGGADVTDRRRKPGCASDAEPADSNRHCGRR